MPQPLSNLLQDAKVVFTRGFADLPHTPDRVIFNAPRPLLGAEVPCREWCHGRFYSEVDPSEMNAQAIIKQNNDLDARVVVNVTDQELVEMLLMESRYREKYRALPFDDQLEMLLPKLPKIQGLDYGIAMAMLDTAQASVGARSAADSLLQTLPACFKTVITLNLFLGMREEDIDLEFAGSISDAVALAGQTVDVCQSTSGGFVLAPASTPDGEEATVGAATYRLLLADSGEPIELGTFADPHAMVMAACKLKSRLAG